VEAPTRARLTTAAPEWCEPRVRAMRLASSFGCSFRRLSSNRERCKRTSRESANVVRWKIWFCGARIPCYNSSTSQSTGRRPSNWRQLCSATTRMPRLRFQPPDRLLGAAKFSASDDLRGSLNAVKLVKSQRWVWDELREACDLEVNYARHRDPGHWELACIAYITSGQVDVQPWWDNASDELWDECGFEVRPSYATTWRRLAELEDVLRRVSTQRCD